MIGYVTMGMAVAPMIAPTIGGVLETLYGWRASFAFLMAFGEPRPAVRVLAPCRNEPQSRLGGLGPTTLHSYAEPVPFPPVLGLHPGDQLHLGRVLRLPGRRALRDDRADGAQPGRVRLLLCHRAERLHPGQLCLRPVRRPGRAEPDDPGRHAHRRWPVSQPWRRSSRRASCIPAALFGPMFFIGAGNGLVLPSGIAGAVSVKPDVAGAAAGLSGSVQIGFGALVAPLDWRHARHDRLAADHHHGRLFAARHRFLRAGGGPSSVGPGPVNRCDRGRAAQEHTRCCVWTSRARTICAIRPRGSRS